MSNTSQASQRITALLDDNSFVEIGAKVTARATDFNLKQTPTPSDGVITGYGVIDGNPVYVYSQDASVLGGSVGEMHAKKIVNLYDLALKTGAPVIGLIDSAGLRLQESTDALNGFGEIYRKQAQASGVIPQITAVFGNCGGGLALISGLTDFTFMESTKAKLFVNSPNAIQENYTEKCDTASAAFQSESGLVDFVGEEGEILANIRSLIGMLPGNNEENDAFEECTDDLNRVNPEIAGCTGDTSLALSLLADSQNFVEVKSAHAKNMVTGFLRLNGATVGAVANRSEIYDEDGKAEKLDSALTADGCEKAADFVSFCDAFDIPVLSLTNVKGYAACKCSEKRIARAAAKLAYAFASATVPKVNVIIGDALGSAYTVMNSKALGADITCAWSNAQIGAMDAKLAAKIICDGQDAAAQEACAAQYAALQASAESAAQRGYVDQIIEAADTRKYVIGAFEMLFTKREEAPSRKHGTV
ncbi:MAG: carboxyl transferase domain-containing protein [Eubacteriales bacterium]|nr:carboxyl transferase domain-containing protein [Eubacteriales bacterium]